MSMLQACLSGFHIPICVRRKYDTCGFQNIFKAGKPFL